MLNFTVYTNLFLLFLVPLDTISQSYSTRNFSTSNGLLSNSINDCNFDKNGFLWIATQAGISRFDGRTFKNYASNNFDGIKSNRFIAIYKFNNGKLMVSNCLNQLFLINKNSELNHVKSLSYGRDYVITNDKKIHFLSKGDILKIKTDLVTSEKNNLLFLTKDKSFYQLQDSFIFFNKITRLDCVNHISKPNYSFVIKNNFYIITKDKYLKVYNNGKFIKSYNLSKIFGNGIHINDFWINSNNDLYSLNVKNELYTIIEIDNELKFIKENVHIAENEKLTKVEFFKENISVVYSNINGLSFLQPKFMNVTGLSDYENLNKVTYKLLTQKNGEVFSNIHYKSFLHLKNLNNTSLSFNIGLDTVCLIHQNKIYYNANNKFYKYQLEYIGNVPSKNEYKDFLLDNNKVYLTSKHIVFELTKPNILSPLIYLNAEITATCLMKDKKFWLIGTASHGIFKYNAINKTFTVLNYFINKDIRSIKYDTLLNKYWVFTYGSGIYWLDSKLNATPFQNYKTSYLAFAHYYLNDTQGNYWIPSNNGLIRFEKKEILKRNVQQNLKIYYQFFSDEVGVSGNEFNGGYSNSGLILPNGYLAFSSNKGVITINPYLLQNEENRTPIIIDEILVNDSKVEINSFYKFKESYFTFELLASSSNYNFGMSSIIEYKIPELNINWEPLEGHKLKLYSLKRGKYNIYLRKTGTLDNRNYKNVVIEVLPPWHVSRQAFIMYLFIGLMISLIVFVLVSRYKKKKIKSNLQLIESELKALRAQINPHYLSNSLIGLQNSIMDGNHEKSIKFISTFSKVMRNMLFNSEKSLTPIENEIKILRDYVALENINREQFVKFKVHKEFNTFLKLSDIHIPTNILQPLVENAIIHGFSEYLNRNLFIQIKIVVNYDNLNIEIIDNGIGYQPSEHKKDSFGLKNLKLVIQQLQVKYNKTLKFEIANRTDAQGTIVHLTLPLITNNNDKK